MQEKRSELPVPSNIFMESRPDWSRHKLRSMSEPSLFGITDPSSENSQIQEKRSELPVPSDRSKKTRHDFSIDLRWSMHKPLVFGTTTDPSSVNRYYLKWKFQCLNEVITNQETPKLLNEIYTELYITEGGDGEINNEHELRQIEGATRRKVIEDTTIKCSDIFKPLSEPDKPIRTVLTKGIAGIGKSVSVQKFILDWAEGRANQDIQLIFPLPFRELNLMKENLSLMDLLHVYFNETKGLDALSSHKALFICDGLDECRFPLDFQSSVSLCDVTQSSSVDVLVTNLIKGNLLPSALIWITSRPAAANQIPSEYVDRVTEVRGFKDPQKEEYFRKRISDQGLANRIITHMKSSRSLYIMCHIPVFCWIAATVLERILAHPERGEIPRTLTEMYTHFLITQTNTIRQKYTINKKEDDEILLKLGQLAFQQLMKGNLVFYEEDLRECGIDVTEASVYTGVCTQLFREECGLHLGKVYCFVHLSIQEHLAALYVHLTFVNNNTNVLQQSRFSKLVIKKDITDLHKSAVDQALRSKREHLDLFLRFLLGLSQESNQILLQDLMTETRRISHGTEEIVHYIKRKIRENPSHDKSVNLFHCLNELGDVSLEEEIQNYLRNDNLNQRKLSYSQWSAVVFVLLTSGESLDVFELNKYSTSDEALLKLKPVVAVSSSALLTSCKLTKKSCVGLSSVLSSESSCLRMLDLNGNKLGNSGVTLLSAGLENPQCKLKTLRLKYCDVTEQGCAALASALRLNPSHLRELDLSGNKIGDPGVTLLSVELEKAQCKLENLWLMHCDVTEEGCGALASVLTSNSSHLRTLSLTGNHVGASGVKLLSFGLGNPHCKLESLWLKHCDVTEEGCGSLALALVSNPSHLRLLDLSRNKLSDSGVKMLCVVLEDPRCKIESLGLCECDVTDDGCAALASALTSNPSHMRELNFYWNKLGHSGKKLLSDLKDNQICRLQALRI